MENVPKLIIGFFGLGTVGGPALELLCQYEDICVKWACVRHVSKPRSCPVKGCKLTTQYSDILEDKEVNMIVEVMGGVDEAFEIVKQAIMKKKHVVTANKAMLSARLPALEALLKEHPEVQFHYEASVCGGIPVIASMRRSLVCDVINKLTGIMNGTTNYILTQMRATGAKYKQALADAQDKGFAEADPAADVNGYDARSKLIILTKLAFGLIVDEGDVECVGIQSVTSEDFAYANMINHSIKLLAVAERSQPKDGGPERVFLSVAPVLVPLSHFLAGIEGVSNAVVLETQNLGSCCLTGPGAGGFPTANSVVSDILDIKSKLALEEAERAFGAAKGGIVLERDYEATFYIRLNVDDQLGIIAKVAEVFSSNGVSVFSILQVPIVNPNNVPFAIVTDLCRRSQVAALCKDLEERRTNDLPWLIGAPLCLRYLK